MAKSTAPFIAYDLRPAKQTERRGIVEFLNCARQSGLDLSSYRYVGFGGTKFVDFQLMHKYIGFKLYQSIEHDTAIYNRCVFNRPFDGIDVFKGPLSNFLATDKFEGSSVYWFDYEKSIGSPVFTDLNSLAARVKDGDLVFISISGEIPGTLLRADDKRQALKDMLPSLRAAIDKLKPIDLTAGNFPKTSGRMLLLMLRSAFAKRIADGEFVPEFRVLYKDSSWMVTVGGAFHKVRSRQKAKLVGKVRKTLAPMCPAKKLDFYNLPQFNFTQFERLLLDKSSVSQGTGYVRRLKTLGFSVSDLQQYEEISRFVPKYIEAAF